MRYRILISGSLAYDHIMDFPGRFRDHIMTDKVHALSVSFSVRKMETRFGGNSGNIAYTLKFLGDDPIILARAGNDFSAYAQWLMKHRINVLSIEIDHRRHTAVAHIITDRDDNQIASFAPGATHFPYTITATRLKTYHDARLALVGPSQPTDMMRQCRAWKRAHIPYIADPGQEITALTRSQLLQLIQGAEALFGNDYEIELISKKVRKSKSQLVNMVKFLVVTLGAKGSTVYQGNKVWRIAAVKPKRLVDPTGAGDAYRAGFIHAYVRSAPYDVCGKIASLVAARAIEHYGTQEHSLSKTDRTRIRALLSHLVKQ